MLNSKLSLCINKSIQYCCLYLIRLKLALPLMFHLPLMFIKFDLIGDFFNFGVNFSQRFWRFFITYRNYFDLRVENWIQLKYLLID